MVIAGTGHRPQKLTTNTGVQYSYGLVNALAEFLTPYLTDMHPSMVIAGGALGVDTGLAVAAIKLAIPLTLAIPCYGQSSRWKANSRHLYDEIMERATETVFVEPGPYAAWKMQSRNQWMVDHSDLLLALWDGSEGGTANCIQYANKVGRETLNLWHDWTLFKAQYKL